MQKKETRMKQFRMFLYTLLCSLIGAYAQAACPIDNANPCGAAPYFSIRSHGENAVRELVGWQELINLCGMDDFYGAISVVGEYSESFRSKDIGRVLFGSDYTSSPELCCPTIMISGSQSGFNQSDNGKTNDLVQRGPNDWLAEYFYLPVNWRSAICFSPKIKNFVADVELYLGMAQWADGLYARLHLPITWTKWDLRPEETIFNPGITVVRSIRAAVGGASYPSGYFSPQGISSAELVQSALNFFNGSQVPFLPSTSKGINIPIQFDPLMYSKWNNCCDSSSMEKTRLADFEMVFGYNFVCNDNGYFGLNARAAAPTGNKPCGEFLFEPIAGNGGHWQLGGGVDAHAVMWRGEHDNTLSFYLDANITHLFKACQRRCFDLCGKPNSRYMLAEKLTTNTVGLAGDTLVSDTACTDSSCILSDAQFANEFSPVANLTITQVKVSAAVQGDVALKFTYNNGNGFSWDLGYNFFGRSCEKICRVKPTPLIDGNTWALKGDAFVYGFLGDPAGNPIPLAATESCATIHSGTNKANFFIRVSTAVPPLQTNENIDNPEFAITEVAGVNNLVFDSFTENQTKTSIQPIFLTEDDVDLAGTRIISNKIFTHFNYSWLNRTTWTPFLGFGASIEVAHHEQKQTSPNCCNTCRNTGVSQGAIWVKGGAAWN